MNERKLPSLADIINDNVTLPEKQNGLNILLNQTPPDVWVKNHPFAKNVKYIPIDKVEYLLTKIFIDWYPEIKEIKLIGNSINCIVRLHYRNPITQEMQWVDGVGACPVQTDAGEKASDFDKIKSDAIMKASPAAKSYAIKDAAECLGRIFGKDLNRKDTVGYESLKDDNRFNGATITKK
jgi:hypothetical protein